MADLPPSRMDPLTPPFYYTSCDYCDHTGSRLAVTKPPSTMVSFNVLEYQGSPPGIDSWFDNYGVSVTSP